MEYGRINLNIIIPILLLLIALGGAFGYYRYSLIKKELQETKEKSLETSRGLNKIIENLQMNLASSTVENRDLNDILTILRGKNIDFQTEIQEKNYKVNELVKLTETDKELLQKYSKVYFLNENYVPSELAKIDSKFLFIEDRVVELHAKVKPYLENMISAARSEGIDLSVLSGYRSFETQKDVKAKHNLVYGTTAANKFSADQGYSEHQLGTTFDLTTKKTGASLNGFENTPAYTWLLKNAHVYGFTLSYPMGNSYYIFEPWHWRFVGISLATYIHTQRINFYDLTQEKINEYLIKIFD